jgi:hypothetical protein
MTTRARATLEEGWVDYVASGQFADVIARRDADVALETIREARTAWYAGVAHGCAMLLASDLDPAVVSAVADELLAWVRAEEGRGTRRASRGEGRGARDGRRGEGRGTRDERLATRCSPLVPRPSSAEPTP